MTSDLIRRLGAIPGVTEIEERADGLWVLGDSINVEAMASEMNAMGIRMGTMTAIPLEDGETILIYHYLGETRFINVKTKTHNGAQASLARLVRAADWCEREIKDLFAVDFPNHPNLIPLFRPAGHPEGMFRAAMCKPRTEPKA